MELYIGHHDAKKFFSLLKEQQTEIEAAVGTSLDWQELPDRKGSRIAIYKSNTDPTDDRDWVNQHTWIADMLERFDGAFRQRVKALDASEWIDEAGEAAAE